MRHVQHPSIGSIDQAGNRPAELVSHFLRFLSLLIASVTVAITPWILGGAIHMQDSVFSSVHHIFSDLSARIAD